MVSTLYGYEDEQIEEKTGKSTKYRLFWKKPWIFNKNSKVSKNSNVQWFHYSKMGEGIQVSQLSNSNVAHGICWLPCPIHI